jgi:hypothetical protein
MQSRRSVFVLAILLLLLPIALEAEQMILETEAGAEALGACSRLHNINSCEMLHMETGVTVSVGVSLRLSGRTFVVEWTGPGYYLESGVILEPMGETRSGLGGQRWLEVYPHKGRIHTSRSWKDTDGNRALSASDTLELDADRALVVKDVRLHLRVSPVSQ